MRPRLSLVERAARRVWWEASSCARPVRSPVAGGPVLFANFIDQLHAVVGPDQLSEIVEQLDDGEGLLRRPISGDGEGDGESACRGWGHGLPLRRLRARSL